MKKNETQEASLPTIDPDHLCARCMALCCRYVTIEIDKPTTKRDKDDVRWYLLHEGITLLIEDGRWMVKFPSRCSALTEDNTCSIYENRPQTCREYTTENCDYYTAYEGWDTKYTEIETPEEYDKYLQSRSRKKKSSNKKSSTKKKK